MSHFLNNEKKVKTWLGKMKIKNYIIHPNLTVDVDDSVNLHNQNLTHLPIQFGVVSGSFDISKNLLPTLKGSPHKVGLSFVCRNNQLNSLKYAPQEVMYDFFCDNNQLTQLDFLPPIINGTFNCAKNNLTSLIGGPQIVKGDYICNDNHLINLEGLASLIVGGLYCAFNPIKLTHYQDINLEHFLHACKKIEKQIVIFQDLYEKDDNFLKLLIEKEKFQERMEQLKIQDEHNYLNSQTKTNTIIKKVKL